MYTAVYGAYTFELAPRPMVRNKTLMVKRLEMEVLDQTNERLKWGCLSG